MRSLFDPWPVPLPLGRGGVSARSVRQASGTADADVAPIIDSSSPALPFVAGSRDPGIALDRATPRDGASVDPKIAALDRKIAAVAHTESALRAAGLSGRLWRGDTLSASSLSSVPSGFRALDEQLPDGGWPAGSMTELMLTHAGIGEIRFLAATLSSLTQAGREIVLLGPPHIPDPVGWEQLGIDMRRVLVVRTPRPVDRLWALEQSLKSAAFGALIAWLPEERTLARPDALRRLQLAAASAAGVTFVFRPAAAAYQPSPAPLRLALAAGRPEGSRRTLAVRLLKRRGPVLAKPLTLPLPEILHGLRAFPVAESARVPSVRLPTGSLRPTTVAHDLAGPVLSHADA